MNVETARIYFRSRFNNIKNFSISEQAKFKGSLMANFKLPKWYTDPIHSEQMRAIYAQMNNKISPFGEFQYFYTFDHSQLTQILNKQFHIPNWYLPKLTVQQMQQICEIKLVIAQKVDYMTDHEFEVSKIVKELAPCFGLNEKETETLELIALFHDIGKVNVASEYLNAREHKLTEDEYNSLVKPHAFFSGEIFKDYPILRDYSESTKYHHKHWTGQGYPRESEEEENLSEHNIPLFSRILAIADSYQAMIDERGYKASKSARDACIELIEQAGFQFDPVLAFKAASKLGGFANKTIDYSNYFKYHFENVKKICSANNRNKIEKEVVVYEGKKKQSIKFDNNNDPISIIGSWVIKSKGYYLIQAITHHYLKGIILVLGFKGLDFNINVRLPLEELLVNAMKHGCQEDKWGTIYWSDELYEKEISFGYSITKDKLIFSIYYPSKQFDLEEAFSPPDPYLNHHRGMSYMVKKLVDNICYKYDKDSGCYTVTGEIPLSTPKSISSKKKQK